MPIVLSDLYLGLGVLVRYNEISFLILPRPDISKASIPKSIAQIPVPVARSITRCGFLIGAR